MRWIWTLGLVGCAAPLAEDFEAELTEEGGCGDLWVFAVDAGDTLLLTVNIDGPIAAAAGVDATSDYALPDAAVQITLDVGSSVSDRICDDVVENGGPQVRETWTAVSGAVHLEVVFPATTGGYPLPDANVELTDVVLESEGGEQVTVESLGWEGVQVGWLAG